MSDVATVILTLFATIVLFRGGSNEKRRVTVIEDSGKTPLSNVQRDEVSIGMVWESAA